MAVVYNLVVDQGATVIKTLVLNKAPNTPKDLTGYVGRMQVRRSYDGPIVLDLSTANGKLAITPVEGKIEILLTPADTDPLSIRGESMEGVYDMELVSDAGEVTRLIQGTFTISKQVTR